MYLRAWRDARHVGAQSLGAAAKVALLLVACAAAGGSKVSLQRRSPRLEERRLADEEARCPVEQDVVILVDSSACVGEANFKLGKDFLLALLRRLPLPQMHVGVLRFEDSV